MMNKGKPGVLLFFDALDNLFELDDENAGRVVKAVIRYAETGDCAVFENVGERLVFRALKDNADRSDELYTKRAAHGNYMTLCRKAKAEGVEPVTFSEYLAAYPDFPQQDANSKSTASAQQVYSKLTNQTEPKQKPNRTVTEQKPFAPPAAEQVLKKDSGCPDGRKTGNAGSRPGAVNGGTCGETPYARAGKSSVKWQAQQHGHITDPLMLAAIRKLSLLQPEADGTEEADSR